MKTFIQKIITVVRCAPSKDHILRMAKIQQMKEKLAKCKLPITALEEKT